MTWAEMVRELDAVRETVVPVRAIAHPSAMHVLRKVTESDDPTDVVPFASIPIISARALQPYRLLMEMSDGSMRTFDLTPK